MNKAFHLLLSDCWILRRICAWRLECRSWCSGVLWDVQTTGTGSSSEIFIIRMTNWLIPKSLYKPNSLHWYSIKFGSGEFEARSTLSSFCAEAAHIILLGGTSVVWLCLIWNSVWADHLLQVTSTWMSRSRVSKQIFCTVVIWSMLFPLTITGFNVVVSDQCKLMQEPFSTVRGCSSYERNWYRLKAAHNNVLRSV